MTVALAISALILLAIDWAQTLRIAREPELFYEKWNLVLGAHPSVALVHLYFAAVAALCAGIAWALWAHPLVVGGLALAGAVIELACVVNNYRAGIKP